jgi:fermentation-respiration switch protein FrsA (DUF1100 family)
LRCKIGNALDPQTYAGMDFERARFVTTDGILLDGWYVPSPKAKDCVVICHGLGANKGNFFAFVTLFYHQGYNVLIFDFRGHGDSGGHTSGFGLLEDQDVLAAVHWLKTTHPDEAEHIYGLGSSMGAAALLRASCRTREIEAIILDSCFASADFLAQQRARTLPGVGPLFARITMAFMSVQLGESLWNLAPVEDINQLHGRPVFLIHAQHDEVIPLANEERLYAAAREPKEQWVATGTHSNVLTNHFDEYQRRVLDFLAAAQNHAHREQTSW